MQSNVSFNYWIVPQLRYSITKHTYFYGSLCSRGRTWPWPWPRPFLTILVNRWQWCFSSAYIYKWTPGDILISFVIDLFKAINQVLDVVLWSVIHQPCHQTLSENTTILLTHNILSCQVPASSVLRFILMRK